jgi:MFS family permease
VRRSDNLSEAAPSQSFASPLSIAIVTLATLCIAVTYGFGLYLFAVIEPALRREIGFEEDITGGLTAIGMAGFLVFSLISGWLRDRIGANALTIATLVLCSLFLAWQATATTVWELGVQRFLLGACTATIWSPMVEIVPRFIERRFQGRVLGLISSGTNFGLVMNGGLAFVVLSDGDWRDLFLVTAVLSAALVLAWAPAVTMRSPQAKERSDTTTAETPPLTSDEQALVPRPVRPILAIAGLAAFTGMPATSFLAAFATEDLGFPATAAAVAWTLMGVIGMVSGVGLGAIGDRLGYRTAFSVALGVLLVGPAMFALSIQSLATPILIAASLAIGFFPIYGLIPSYIAKSTPPAAATRTFGFVNVALGLAGMLGNAAAGFGRVRTGDHLFFFAFAGILVAIGFLVVRRMNEPGALEQPR